jgi:large subunit ribosomal protein L13
MKSTYMAKTDEIPRKWWLIDANGRTLGRLATQVATLVRGKHKPQFTPHIDTGDFVVIINAEKIKMTGKKMLQKEYFRHSGYFGGLKSRTAEEMIVRDAEKVILLAVKGMLPTNKLSRHLLTKVKVFEGPEHTHDAQKPEAYKLDS